MNSKLSSYKILLSKLSLLLKGVKKKSFISFILLIFQGLTEGVSLLLIIPLLAISGVGKNEMSNNYVIQAIQNLFETTGIGINIINVLILYITVMILSSLLKYYQAITTATINQKVVVFWRESFFKKLTYASWSSIQSIKSSDIQDVLTIEIRKFGGISNQLIQFSGSFILIIVYLTISAFLSLKFTLLSLFPILLIALLNKPINKKTYSLGKSTVGLNKYLQSIILEHLASMKLVKSYQKEESHAEEFGQANKEMEQKVISFAKASQKTKVLFEIIAAFIIAVYIYLAISVFKIELTALLLLIFIFARLLPKATKLVSNFQQILNQLPAMEFTFDLINQFKPEREFIKKGITQFQLENEILFHNVHFSYDSKAVHTNSNFAIYANKTNVLIGASGTGKSTTIDLIMGFQEPSSGNISIDGKSIDSIDLNYWKSTIAYVPQDPFLFHKTIRENILWANSAASETEIWEALEKSGAKNFLQQLPNGLETIVGNRGTQLSGGERQRIALARALIKNPQLLILDEATNAIDDENEELIKAVLKKLGGSMTIIIVAHRSNLIELADHTIQL